MQRKLDATLRAALYSIISLIAGIQLAYPRDYFNPAMLDKTNAVLTDLTVFENTGSQAPGVYHIDIFLNNEKVDSLTLNFTRSDEAEHNTLQPCISHQQLESWGVKVSLYPELAKSGDCINLKLIPDARAELDFGAQRLNLSVPQLAVSTTARGYISPDKWQQGINTFLLNYSFSANDNFTQSENSDNSKSRYLNLQPGVNIGPWRVRSYLTWSETKNGEGSSGGWQSVYTYVTRDIIALKSQLTLGESSSPSEIFDGVPLRGGLMASGEEMQPESLKGYAPVVRGIARSEAEITIRQDGYVIYQSHVAAGSFEINDLYATGGSGDLDVTVNEADGSQQHFVVPFASLPVLQREKALKYSVAAGQYRPYDNAVEERWFTQGTLMYGLPWGMTVYGGLQLASPYQALAFGLGKNLGEIGALSVDVIQSRATLNNDENVQGQSWRVRYSKNIQATDTNFAIAGYRYSTSGYRTLQETLDTYRSDGQPARSGLPVAGERQRNRIEASVNQNLWEGAGTLSLSFLSEDYWESQRNMRSVSLGYNNSWRSISYGLNYSFISNSISRSHEGYTRVYDQDRIIAFNMSIPLSGWLSNSYVNYSMSNQKNSGSTHSLSLSGTALENNNLSWSVQQGYSSDGNQSSNALNTSYRGTYGNANVGYSGSNHQRSLSYGIAGGVVAHADGVTLSQPLGDTVILVQAPGAPGVSVTNATGVTTDYRGYGVVPYATPYAENTVSLDPQSLPENTELMLTSQAVVPGRGAVVRATFDAQTGYRVLMTLHRAGKGPVPFGATVTLAGMEGREFIVGDEGQVYLTGMPERGSLTARWGNGTAQQCRADYHLSQQKNDVSVRLADVNCQS